MEKTLTTAEFCSTLFPKLYFTDELLDPFFPRASFRYTPIMPHRHYAAVFCGESASEQGKND